MLGTSLVVQSYVIINDGCPLSITREGKDHVRILCGASPSQGFEIVVQHGTALRALVELGNDMLERISTCDNDG